MLNKSLPVLAALALLTTAITAHASAPILDVSYVSDGNGGDIVTIAGTGADAAANVSGSNYENGFELLNFLDNSTNGPYSGGFFNPAFSPTSSTLISPGGSVSADAINSLTNDDLGANVGQSILDDFQNIDISLYTFNDLDAENFSTTSAAFTGSVSFDVDNTFFTSFLPAVGTTSEVYTGFVGGSPDDFIGQWEMVTPEDMPGGGTGSGVGAAPEPRSWALAGLMGLGFLAIWRRQRRLTI